MAQFMIAAPWRQTTSCPSTQQPKHRLRIVSIKPVLDERAAVTDYLRRNSKVRAQHVLPVARTCLHRHVTQLRAQKLTLCKCDLPPLARAHFTGDSSRERPAFIAQENHTRHSCSVGTDAPSQTAAQLPALSARPSLCQAMLRRPVLQSDINRPRTSGGQLINLLGNYLDLKPISCAGEEERKQGAESVGQGAGTVDQGNFYMTHWPLLLRRVFEDDHDKVMGPRQLAGWRTSEQKRVDDVTRRCGRLERALTQLEREHERHDSANGIFLTELHDSTFDPRSWPWNLPRYQTTL